LGGAGWSSLPVGARAQDLERKESPIKHLIISCQENRSFDHCFGFAHQVQIKGFGPPRGYSQPDATGGRHTPFEFTQLSTPDPPHSWTAVHNQYDGGKMDGFYITAQQKVGDGNAAMGYYTERELPFYLQPARQLGPVRELLLLFARAHLAEPFP